MTQPVTLSKRDAIAVITIDNPPVNALSPGVPEGILTAIETAERDSSVRAIVVIG
jgi:3-hydroxyacyl-CoA dehydrogenase